LLYIVAIIGGSEIETPIEFQFGTRKSPFASGDRVILPSMVLAVHRAVRVRGAELSAKAYKTCFFAVLLTLAAACSKSPDKDLANGEVTFKAGRYKEAVIHFRNAIQVNPELAGAHLRLAQTYLELKSFQAAFVELQRTVELDPRNSEAQLQLATLLISSKKYDDAKTITAKVLLEKPNNANTHAALAERLAATGDPSAAVREYRSAIKHAPKRMTHYFALGALYKSTGHLSDAEAVYKLPVDGDPQSEAAHLSPSQFYSSQDSLIQAEDELRGAAKLAQHDTQSLILLADSDLAQKRFVEAEKICLQLKIVAPDDAEAYRDLATLFLSTGQRENALSELKSLRPSEPRDSWVKSSLGETLLDLNRVQETAAPVRDALASDPNDAKALVLQGRIRLSEGKYSDAPNTLERALKGADQNAAAWFYPRVAQQDLGLSCLSKAFFSQGHMLSPPITTPAVALTGLTASGGNYEESERLAAANPKLPQVEVIGARAELARGNLRKAEQMVPAELEREPNSLPALAILTMTEVQSCRAKQGVRQLSAALSKYPQSAGLEFLLATFGEGALRGHGFALSDEQSRLPLS
jgi:tetratricopeptide (TPR) repeat protein